MNILFTPFSLLPTFGMVILANATAFAADANYWLNHPVSPKAVYEELVNNPRLKENNDGEPFAWHTAGGSALLTGYKIWGDPAWLEYGVQYYDFLLARMRVAPDGYLGLLGRNFRHKFWSDEQVSDALVMNQLLSFAEWVLQDPELERTFGDDARRYVEHAKKHVIEKWDVRGRWHEIGEYGDYVFDNRFVDPAHPDQWVIDDVEGSGGMSQKFNIANKLGRTNIHLWRITGDEFYRDKAEKLFFRLKSNFQLYDGGYTWHYWIPFYEGDVFFDEERLIHWTAVHPFRPGYQAEEVHQIVEAYHNGIVFSETDIRRILHTNLEVMWNGDLENPVFNNSNGLKPLQTEESKAFQKSHSGSGVANRGQLWSALVDFDPTVRELYEGQITRPKTLQAKVNAAHYYTHVKPNAPSFVRQELDGHEVKVKEVPLGNSQELVVATVIPHQIKQGVPSVIITKSIASGPLKVELFSADGAQRLGVLYDGDIFGDYDGQKGFRMIQWDGTHPDGSHRLSGDFLVRWTLGAGHRDYAVTIVEND